MSAMADGQLLFIGGAKTAEVLTRPGWPPGAGDARRAALVIAGWPGELAAATNRLGAGS
jgi:hypothetical protein